MVEWSNSRKKNKEYSDLTNCKNVKRSNGRMVEKKNTQILPFGIWFLKLYTLYFGLWTLSPFLTQQHFYFSLSSAYGVPLAQLMPILPYNIE